MSRLASSALLALLLSSAGSVRPSPGCSISNSSLVTSNISASVRLLALDDPKLGATNRTYLLNLPQSAADAPRTPAPLLLVLHGQGGNVVAYNSQHRFDALGEQHRFLSVYLQGADDGATGPDSGWNVGHGGGCANGTAGEGLLGDCLNATCFSGWEGQKMATNCHKSCAALGVCGACSWATCYDDVAFVQALLARLGAEFCLDLDALGVVGESNGAMLVHHLAAALPGTCCCSAELLLLVVLVFLQCCCCC